MLVIWTTTTLGITKPLYSGCFFFTSSVSWLRNANCKSKVMHEVNWPTTAPPVWTMDYVPLVRSNVSKLLFLILFWLSRLQLIHILGHFSGRMYFWLISDLFVEFDAFMSKIVKLRYSEKAAKIRLIFHF